MQIHPGPYSLPWHTSDNSDLSLQWGQLSRPYSSTDQSSSLGSMESLDTPTPTAQLYSDSRNSPVDSALFNNKRDSAYSSFSASSNTSDNATVPLRPGETCSMDNLLQSIAPSCRGYSSGDHSTLGGPCGENPNEPQLIAHKSRSLTRPRPKPVRTKERPSSCCYEDERREILRNVEHEVERKMNPPQPPTRKDSFKAIRGRPTVLNKYCDSTPLKSQSANSHGHDENRPSLTVETTTHNGFASFEDEEQNRNFKKDILHSECIPRKTMANCQTIYDKTSNTECNAETPLDDLGDPSTTTLVPSPCPGSLPADPCVEVQKEDLVVHASSALHRHSAPEKLLATQLELTLFNSDSPSVEPYKLPVTNNCSSSASQWSHSSTKEMQVPPHSYHQAYSNKYDGSRSSTPGSAIFAGDDDMNECVSDKLEGRNVNGAVLAPAESQRLWGRSASVPDDRTETPSHVNPVDMVDRDFKPLSGAASVDTLLEAQRAVGVIRSEDKREEEMDVKRSSPSRSHRRNRRHSERFATNLRNEIQRKKAQLQRNHGPGGLLCSGETVQEEEGPEVNEDGTESDISHKERSDQVSFPVPSNHQEPSTTAPLGKSNQDELHMRPKPTTFTENITTSRSVQILDPGVPKFGVGIRVVEEPAPAGKARRWRWTPEHKLQPEPDQRHGVVSEQVLGITQSRHGVCAFTSSSTSSLSRSSRLNETDLLPFADRMKFFEETSKGASNVSNLASRRDKTSRLHPEPQGEHSQRLTQRRHSYQGGVQESSPLQSTVEARRMSVSTNRERQKEKDKKQERERVDRVSRFRERDRQQERERQEMELRMETEIQQERVRQWERERERELALEREQEMERAREMELLRKDGEQETERQRERLREEDNPLASHQHFYGDSDIPERNQDVQQMDHLRGFHLRPQAFPSSQVQDPVARSAFHPVNQYPEHQPLPLQGYTARSYAVAEPYPTHPQEATKLSRKYSFTEKEDPSWRRDPRHVESLDRHPQHQNQGGWAHRHIDSSSSLSLRGRAMSENDLRFDSGSRWPSSISVAASQTLSEVEEGAGELRGRDAARAARSNRKKTPPPPRPPPPNWEQFHRRRASHHALFPSSSCSSSPPHPPPSVNTQSSAYMAPLDTARQRSYSSPPERQSLSESCPHCTCNQSQSLDHRYAFPTAYQNAARQQQLQLPYSHAPSSQMELPYVVAPPSPMFSRRAFRPVALPQEETNMGNLHAEEQQRVETLKAPPPPPRPVDNSLGSWCVINQSPVQDTVTVNLHKQQPSARPAAEWERRERVSSPRGHGNSGPPPFESGEPGRVPSQPVELQHQQHQQQLQDQQKLTEPGTDSEATLSPSPAHSLDADLDVPMETDIDDFQEEDGTNHRSEPITSELPCLALPVTVLETDIDTSPRAGRASVEAEEKEELESSREQLSLEELFPHNSEEESAADSWRGLYPGTEQHSEHSTNSLDRRSGASSSCSSYYSTSATKAQLLSQIKDHCSDDSHRGDDDDDELTYKKQLMESLRKKLGVLREAQRGLQDDIRANAQLGEEVENMVVGVCKPNEVDKFRMFIGDLDKVVNLLLSLSARLRRVDGSLDTLDPETEHHERLPLLEKKHQLKKQLSEAQDLKDHVDRREQAVSRVLARCLSAEQHRDYCHFVKMKAALLVEQRQLEDKIRMGEEQLRGLRESLGLGLGIGLGMSMGYGHF